MKGRAPRSDFWPLTNSMAVGLVSGRATGVQFLFMTASKRTAALDWLGLN